MNETDINDVRSIQEFKGITFSEYKRSLVKKELLNCLTNEKIEEACNWSAEYICAGQFADLWEIILFFIGKNIHLGNPKLPIYIKMRFDDFKTIICNGYIGNELSMRNNVKIRKLFAEVICVLCNSKKKHSFESIKIKKQNEFDITQLTSKLQAPNIEFCKDSFLMNDPKELFIVINEFAYHVSQKSKNVLMACYWIEWTMEFERICKIKKESCACEYRTFAPVSNKFQNDLIWIIWDVILKEATKTKNKILIKIINSLLSIFSIKYSPPTKRKRRYLLYFAVALLIEHVDYNINMIENKKEIEIITNKINIIYKQIKKNEQSPKTDYLFNGIENKSNLNKTIEKLEKMNTMNFMPTIEIDDNDDNE